MHPTVDEQLHGIGRLLDAMEAESVLSADSTEALINARRLLKQLSRSWATLTPFYVTDNRALEGLLRRCAESVPGVPTVPPEQPGAAQDLASAAQRNAALREVLARVVTELPATEPGREAAAAILEYLTQRVETDPS